MKRVIIKKGIDIVILMIGLHHINSIDKDSFYLKIIIIGVVFFALLLLNAIVFKIIDNHKLK